MNNKIHIHESAICNLKYYIQNQSQHKPSQDKPKCCSIIGVLEVLLCISLGSFQ